MGARAVHCTNCGAGMAPGADGHTYACRYCGLQILVEVEAEQLAAGMKLDLSNVGAFLHRLAQTLEAAFPERTKIQRQGADVVAIEVIFDADGFAARREAHGVVAHHKKIVRGIALKNTTHPLDRWVSLLQQSLAAHANENARASAAVAALFGKH